MNSTKEEMDIQIQNDEEYDRLVREMYWELNGEKEKQWQDFLASAAHKLLEGELTPETYDEVIKRMHSAFEEAKDSAYEEAETLAYKVYCANNGKADHKFVEAIKNITEKFVNVIRDTCKELVNGVKDTVERISTSIKNKASEVKVFAETTKDKIIDTAQNVRENVRNGASNLRDNVVGKATDVRDSIRDFDYTIRSAVLGKIAEVMTAMNEKIDKTRENITKEYSALYRGSWNNEFSRANKASGFKSINPQYSNINSKDVLEELENAPYVKALGVYVEKDENENLLSMSYSPNLDKDYLNDIAQTVDGEINGLDADGVQHRKTLAEWLNTPDVNVEVNVRVFTNEENYFTNDSRISPLILISDSNGKFIGATQFELAPEETKQTLKLVREISEKAALIDDIAQKAWSKDFGNDNAELWVAPLKTYSVEDLSNLNCQLAEMSEEKRKEWGKDFITELKGKQVVHNKKDVERD